VLFLLGAASAALKLEDHRAHRKVRCLRPAHRDRKGSQQQRTHTERA